MLLFLLARCCVAYLQVLSVLNVENLKVDTDFYDCQARPGFGRAVLNIITTDLEINFQVSKWTVFFIL